MAKGKAPRRRAQLQTNGNRKEKRMAKTNKPDKPGKPKAQARAGE
jgi:hypothetical protein